MDTYIILSKISAEAFRDPKEFPNLARKVADEIKAQCPKVVWKDSYATMGRFDVVDVVEAPSAEEVEKAAMIIRAYGHSTTETMRATPWKAFVEMLKK